MSGCSLVVTGAPGLAEQLRRTGRFTTVLEAATTGGLRDLIAQGTLGAAADKATTVFMFADNTPCDTPETPLPRLVQKLTSTGWKVLVVAATPAAAETIATNPAAGLLEGPFSVNGALAALAAMGVRLEPVESGFEHFDLFNVPAPAQAADAAGAHGDAPQDGGWLTVSASPAQQQSAQSAPSQNASAATGSVAAWGQSLDAQRVDAQPAAPQAASAPWGQPQAAGSPSVLATSQSAGGGTSSWLQTATGTAAPPESTSPFPTLGAPAGGATQLPSLNASLPALGAALPGLDGAVGQPAARVGSYGPQHQLAAARRGHVIVVTAPKGGTGKSSLSLNLTAYLGLRMRAHGKTVCIIDTNFQQADAGKYLNVYTPNITDLYKDQAAMTRERIRTKMVHRDELGFSALLGPARSREANPQWINARLYNQILPLLKEHYDYIIVDTPVAELYHDIHRDFALPNADFILVPITPNLPTLMNADRWLYEICQPTHVAGGSGVDRNKVGIVLNRAKDTVGLSFEEIQTELSQWRIVGVIPDTDEWQRANNENSLVATRNYRELNDAFSQVLHAATGEPSLLEGVTAIAVEPDGLLGRLKARFSR